MSFASDDLAAIGRTEEVEIETHGADGSVRRTIIWAVVDAPDVFVRTYRGAGSRWYREALAQPEVALLVEDRRLPARAVPAVDPDSVRRTSEGFLAKYSADPAAPAMVREEVLATTLRLEPA